MRDTLSLRSTGKLAKNMKGSIIFQYPLHNFQLTKLKLSHVTIQYGSIYAAYIVLFYGPKMIKSRSKIRIFILVLQPFLLLLIYTVSREPYQKGMPIGISVFPNQESKNPNQESKDTSEILMHALLTSYLDNEHALLNGISEQLKKL